MKPERLQEIREYASELFAPHRLGDIATVELIEYVDQLTGERDRARDLAVRSDAFTNPTADESRYSHILNTGICEHCGEERTGYCAWCIATPNAAPEVES